MNDESGALAQVKQKGFDVFYVILMQHVCQVTSGWVMFIMLSS